jgi:hypothetical protein
MSILEIILIVLVFGLSAGFIAVTLNVGSDIKPVLKRVMTYTMLTPVVNTAVALFLCYVYFMMLVLYDKEEEKDDAKK